MKRVVVTGGAGFVGTHLANALAESGFRVVVVDNFFTGKKQNVRRSVELCEVDVRHKQALEPIFKDVDTVFHLAAIVSVPYSIEHPRETAEVNVRGTVNVLQAAHNCGVRRVVYASSAAVYGEQDVLPIPETALTNPQSPYGSQKLEGETHCRLFSVEHGLETVILRKFNLYGLRQSAHGPYASVVAKFVELHKQGLPLVITGTGEQTRDLVHVDDAVTAYLAAMSSPKVGAGEVINIGSGKSYSINQIADIVGGAREYVSARQEIQNSLADITRARELLGWRPQVDMVSGIGRLLV